MEARVRRANKSNLEKVRRRLHTRKVKYMSKSNPVFIAFIVSLFAVVPFLACSRGGTPPGLGGSEYSAVPGTEVYLAKPSKSEVINAFHKRNSLEYQRSVLITPSGKNVPSSVLEHWFEEGFFAPETYADLALPDNALDCVGSDLSQSFLKTKISSKRLQWLRLREVTGKASLDSLFSIKWLKGLVLTDYKFTAEELARFRNLRELRWLVLEGCRFPDNGSIPSLPLLEVLSLNHTNVDDSYAPRIGQFPKLTALSLKDTKISGAGVRQLLNANRSLEWLDLFGCEAVGADCAYEFTFMKDLKSLDLGATRIADELYMKLEGIGNGLPVLQVQLPNCSIGHNP